MAHKKAAGSTGLGRESESKRLGIKIQDGSKAQKGSILVRQRGTHYRAGKNVKKGVDDTLFSVGDGVVKITTKKLRKYTNKLEQVKIFNVVTK